MKLILDSCGGGASGGCCSVVGLLSRDVVSALAVNSVMGVG